MSCEDTRRDLEAYADGLLAGQEARRIEEHLARCEACRTEWEDIKKVLNAVSSLPAVNAPRDFKQSVMDKIARSGSTGPVYDISRPPRIRRLLLPLSLAASLAIVALTAYLVFVSQEYTGKAPDGRHRLEEIVTMEKGASKKGPGKAREYLEKKESLKGLGYASPEGRKREGGEEHDKGKGTTGRGRSLDKSQGFISGKKRRGPEPTMAARTEVVEEAEKGSEFLDEVTDMETAETPPSSGFPSNEVVSDLTGQIEKSGLDTLVVMGSADWSIPAEVQYRALSLGHVFQAQFFEPEEDLEEGYEKFRNRQKKITRQRVEATESEGKDERIPKAPGAKSDSSKRKSEKELLGRDVIPSDEGSSDWEYVFFELDREQLPNAVSRLIQSNPIAIMGGRIRSANAKDEDSVGIYVDGDGQTSPPFQVGDIHVLWGKSDSLQIMDVDRSAPAGPGGPVVRKAAKGKGKEDPQAEIPAKRRGAESSLYLRPVEDAKEQTFKLDKKEGKIVRILVIRPKAGKGRRDK